MKKKSGLTAQEYADIQNLYGYYNLCSDDGDAAGFASCFTEDGVLRIETIDMTVNSRRSIEAFKKKDKESRGGKYRRHRGASLHLEKLDDKTVRGRCYFHGYNGTPGELPVLADVGVYEDTIVNVDGDWQFAKRLLRMDAISFKPPTS